MCGFQRGCAEGECGILPGPLRGKNLITCGGVGPDLRDPSLGCRILSSPTEAIVGWGCSMTCLKTCWGITQIQQSLKQSQGFVDTV